MIENNIIKNNVSVADILKVLGTTASDVGKLCTHNNINMWAKYKPTVYDGLGPTNVLSTDTQEQVIAKLEAFQYYQYRANDGNCGLSYSQYGGSITDAMARLRDDKLNGWVYTKPNGTTPYRLGDFHRYYHKASPPLTGFVCDSQTVDLKIHIGGALNLDSGSTLSLALNDIGGLEEYMPAVVIKDKNGRTKTETSSSRSSFDMWIDCSVLAEGRCSAYPYLINRNQIVLFPYAKEVTFENMSYVTQLQFTWLSVDINKNYAEITWSGKLINNGAQDYVFDNCTMYVVNEENYENYIRTKSKSYLAATGNTSVNLGNIQVNQGSSKEINGYINASNSQLTRIWSDLEMVLNNKLYKKFYLVLIIGNSRGNYTFNYSAQVYIEDVSSSSGGGGTTPGGRT